MCHDGSLVCFHRMVAVDKRIFSKSFVAFLMGERWDFALGRFFISSVVRFSIFDTGNFEGVQDDLSMVVRVVQIFSIPNYRWRKKITKRTLKTVVLGAFATFLSLLLVASEHLGHYLS